MELDGLSWNETFEMVIRYTKRDRRGRIREMDDGEEEKEKEIEEEGIISLLPQPRHRRLQKGEHFVSLSRDRWLTALIETKRCLYCVDIHILFVHYQRACMSKLLPRTT